MRIIIVIFRKNTEILPEGHQPTNDFPPVLSFLFFFCHSDPSGEVVIPTDEGAEEPTPISYPPPAPASLQLVGINTLLSFRGHQHPSVIPHFFVIPQRRNPQPKQ
ncbi:MAG: hypothetical protein K9G61_07205 [Bacteroidales bacterium]|nr:hypothetical protein [Bacteroidales bacterium]